MENSSVLNNSIAALNSEVEKFKSILEVYSAITSLKSDLIKLKEQNSDSSDRIKQVASELTNKLKVWEQQLSDMLKENKNFQKELEQHITSKLDKQKSDIQIDIRNESTQIQRAVELALKENTISLEKNLSEKFSKAQKLQVALTVISLLVVLACAYWIKPS